MVKASASGAEDLGFESHLWQDFSGSSDTSGLQNGAPVATLPGTWCYRVSAETGWPGVSILWLGKVESLICNFYLSVAACKIVCADPSLRYTSMLLGREATNKKTNCSWTETSKKKKRWPWKCFEGLPIICAAIIACISVRFAGNKVKCGKLVDRAAWTATAGGHCRGFAVSASGDPAAVSADCQLPRILHGRWAAILNALICRASDCF